MLGAVQDKLKMDAYTRNNDGMRGAFMRGSSSLARRTLSGDRDLRPLLHEAPGEEPPGYEWRGGPQRRRASNLASMEPPDGFEGFHSRRGSNSSDAYHPV